MKNVSTANTPRIPAFDFIKAIAAIGIVCFHFGCHALNLSWLVNLPNHRGDWGGVFVVVFFAVSGSLLYLHHSKIDSLWRFYKRRWLAIFPAFYVAYLLVFLERPMIYNGAITVPHPLKYYLFTLVGMDGYMFAWTQPFNYYILGEWFLGAIILAYLIYPGLIYLLGKNELITTTIVTALFLLTYSWNMLNQDPLRNIFSVIFCFYIGILTMKHRLFMKKNLFLISSLLLILFLFMPLDRERVITEQIIGLLLFLVLFTLGSKVMNIKGLNRVITWLSGISYEIFLLQHVVILYMLNIWNPSNPWLALGLLALTLFRIIVGAFILHLVVKRIVSISGKTYSVLRRVCTIN